MKNDDYFRRMRELELEEKAADDPLEYITIAQRWIEEFSLKSAAWRTLNRYKTQHPYASGFGYALIAGAWVRLLGKKRRGRKTLTIAEKRAKNNNDWIEVAKVAYLHLKDKPRAEQALINAQKAIESSSFSDNPSSWETLALFWKNDMNEIDMAEKVLEGAEQFIDDFNLINLIKVRQRVSNKRDKTIELLEKAGNSAKNTNDYIQIAALWKKKPFKNDEKAIEFLNKAETIAKDTSDYIELSEVLKNQPFMNDMEAFRILEKAQNAQKKCYECQNVAFSFIRMFDDREKAKASFLRAKELAKSYDDWVSVAAIFKYKLNDDDTADDIMKKLKKNPLEYHTSIYSIEECWEYWEKKLNNVGDIKYKQ